MPPFLFTFIACCGLSASPLAQAESDAAFPGKAVSREERKLGTVPFNRAGIVVDPQDDAMKVMTVLPAEGCRSAT